MATARATGLVVAALDMPGKTAQAVAGMPEFETKTLPFREVAFHEHDHIGRHVWLPAVLGVKAPGHGNATSTKCRLSSLA